MDDSIGVVKSLAGFLDFDGELGTEEPVWHSEGLICNKSLLPTLIVSVCVGDDKTRGDCTKGTDAVVVDEASVLLSCMVESELCCWLCMFCSTLKADCSGDDTTGDFSGNDNAVVAGLVLSTTTTLVEVVA